MSRPATDLLAHLAGDLEGCDLVRTAADAAIVTPPNGTPPFAVRVATERRRLLQLTTTVVVLEGTVPPEIAEAETTGERLVLRHTGQVRRTGIEVVARTPSRFARASDEPRDLALAWMAGRLRASSALRDALLPLDSTRAELTRVERGGWQLEVELMGGSHVRTTLPPTQAYVRLAADQRDALLATVAAVAAALPTRPVAGSVAPGARLPSGAAHGLDARTPAGAPAGAGHGHLPSRPSGRR